MNYSVAVNYDKLYQIKNDELTGSMTFSAATCIIANCQDKSGKESTGPYRLNKYYTSKLVC